MNRTVVRVGLAGAVHPNMPGDDEGLYSKTIAAMEDLALTEGFELRVFRPLLRSEEDGEAARNFMDASGADLVILFCASLPYGRVVLPLARARGALGLWSVPEPATTGVLQLNSFCGTNMLGSIVANYLREHRIPYKWFYGAPDGRLFLDRFRVTLRALAALKALRGARIGQIGGLADGFENLYSDERVLEKKFGAWLQTRHTVEEIVARAEAVPAAEAEADVASLSRQGRVAAGLGAAELAKSSRVYLALRGFAREKRYDSLAVSCWARFQQVYGVAVCAALSRLNEDGIAAPCEADVVSAVMMMALNAMNGSKASLNDLVALDEADSSVALWHCGVAPACWADQRGVVWDSHFNIGEHKDCAWCGKGVVADMNFRPGPVTIACMNNDFDDLLILTGEALESKKGYAGSGAWVGGLRLNGAPIGHDDLLNTLVVRRVNHHYAAAQGDLRDELNEFAAWAGLSVLAPARYERFMQNKDWR